MINEAENTHLQNPDLIIGIIMTQYIRTEHDIRAEKAARCDTEAELRAADNSERAQQLEQELGQQPQEETGEQNTLPDASQLPSAPPSQKPGQNTVMSRRGLLIAGGSAAAMAVLLQKQALGATGALNADLKSAPRALRQALNDITGKAKPLEGKLSLQMDDKIIDGALVPFTLSVDSPMIESDYVRALYVLGDGNPRPEMLQFRLSPTVGKAEISSHLRLAKSQNIYAIAQMSNDSFYLVKRYIQVALSGYRNNSY